MMLAISLVLAILPLLGVAWTLINGMITTVDGLFMNLILLMLSGVFALNVYWEARDSGLLRKKTTSVADKASAAKAAPAAAKTTTPAAKAT